VICEIAGTHFPLAHCRKIRTNNPMENLNSQIKRRSRVVGILPNRESIVRLVGTLLMEQNEDWMTGRRYMRLDSSGEDSGPRMSTWCQPIRCLDAKPFLHHIDVQRLKWNDSSYRKG